MLLVLLLLLSMLQCLISRPTTTPACMQPPHSPQHISLTVHPSLPSAQGAFDSIRGRFSIARANATTAVTLAATVPANARAEVRLPFPAAAAATLAATEGGATIYKNGAYVPGVVGISGAAVDAATSTLVIDAGSGTYAFEATF